MTRLCRVVGAGVALVMAGCGASTRTATPTTVAPTTTSIDVAADKALAASIGLQRTDFPPEWSGSPQAPDSSTAADSAHEAACLGIPDSAKDQTADVSSEDFTQAKVIVSSEVQVFRTTADVNADSAALAGPKAQPCLSQSLQAATSTPAGVVAHTSITPGPAAGRPVQEAVATADLSGPGGQVSIEAVFLAEGRIEATVIILSAGGPVPANVVDLAAGRVATRLEAT